MYHEGSGGTFVWDHSFSLYAKLSEKLTFLTPWDTNVRSQEKTFAGVSFSIKLQAGGVFFGIFCEVFKNTNFVEHLRTATTKHIAFYTQMQTYSNAYAHRKEPLVTSSFVIHFH